MPPSTTLVSVWPLAAAWSVTTTELIDCVSSSVIVTTALASAMVALVALLSVMLKVSSISSSVSLAMVTVKVFVVSLALNESVPLVAV